MAEMWYYTSEGKQMEPVTTAELKQLATSGMLKPTDMVWKEGMLKWVRASSTQNLFSDGVTPATKNVAPQTDRKDRDDRPRPERQRDPDRYEDDDDDDRPRRRRRRSESGGMDTGLKVGLILGGSLLGLVLIGVVIIIATRSSPRPAPPVVNFRPPPMPVPPMAMNPQAVPIGPLPIFRGPLTVGPGGLTFNEQLTAADARDFKMLPPSPCKVFTVNMTAGKTYTIRHNHTNQNNFNNPNLFDPYLRLEDSNMNEVARDDDSGGNLNALITYRPTQTGLYRVIATSLGGGTGSFILQITEN
jgi:hypothetical protein